jgi:hypothetical protein
MLKHLYYLKMGFIGVDRFVNEFSKFFGML